MCHVEFGKGFDAKEALRSKGTRFVVVEVPGVLRRDCIPGSQVEEGASERRVASISAAKRTVRVVLVALDWRRAKDPSVSLGHASLVARLRTIPNIDVVPISFNLNDPNFSRDEVLDVILEHIDDDRTFVAIGAYVWNEVVVQKLLPALRASGFYGRIILGGPQISYAPPGIDVLYPDADVFIRGYAEESLASFVASNGLSMPQGVSLRGSDTSSQAAEVDLERLPSPILNDCVPLSRFMRWETQRGCRYSCAFCQHREPGVRLLRRDFDRARVRDEIDAMVHGGVADIAVLDPIFNNSASSIDILQRFKQQGFEGRLSLQCRFERIDDRFLDACDGLNVSLEFGLQTIHADEMKAVGRMNDMGKVEVVIDRLLERGIQFEVSLIYGLPEQTLGSFQASVNWCREKGVPVVRAFPLMLLRGTRLDNDRAQWRLEESTDPIPVVVASSTFDRNDWAAMRAVADELDESAPTGRSPGSRVPPNLSIAGA